jgi:hypothetical protein
MAEAVSMISSSSPEKEGDLDRAEMEVPLILARLQRVLASDLGHLPQQLLIKHAWREATATLVS